MEPLRSPADTVSKAVTALRQQATTPKSKRPPSPGARGLPMSSTKKSLSRVTFSPKPSDVRSNEAPASPEPLYRCPRSPGFHRMTAFTSPYSPYTPTETFTRRNSRTPLTISPSSTVKRALYEQWDQYNKDYKDAILEQDIQFKARLQSVRDITCVTVGLFLLYLVIGTCYYSRWSSAENKWPIHESLIFLIYTCSTVGYGNHDIPSAPSDRMATIIFIMIGIGLVTVLLSEIFQYMTIVTEKARFTHEERKNRMIASIYEEALSDDGVADEENQVTSMNTNSWDRIRSTVFDTYTLCRYGIERNTVGRYFIKFLPFVGLVVLGASVVGSLEGWSWIDSFYWAIVTLTTVGYGDLTPSSPVSIWFCIFFLPTATIFLSLYLSKIAGAYMRLHVMQIKRVESRLEKMHKRMNEKDDWPVLMSMPSGETDQSSPDKDEFLDPFESITDGNRIQSLVDSPTLTSRGNKAQTTSKKAPPTNQPHSQRARSLSMRELLVSTKLNKMNKSTRNLSADVPPTPSLGLRARVQARMAYIVSTELCREEPKIELQDNEIHLVLSNWKQTVEKWMIPKKAKEPLKSLSCEIILSVGVTVIRERGVDALLELNTSKFQRSFNPVLAAFGHAECMEGWMKSTDHLFS